jgi:hypothetical protein
VVRMATDSRDWGYRFCLNSAETRFLGERRRSNACG